MEAIGAIGTIAGAFGGGGGGGAAAAPTPRRPFAAFTGGGLDVRTAGGKIITVRPSVPFVSPFFAGLETMPRGTVRPPIQVGAPIPGVAPGAAVTPAVTAAQAAVTPGVTGEAGLPVFSPFADDTGRQLFRYFNPDTTGGRFPPGEFLSTVSPNMAREGFLGMEGLSFLGPATGAEAGAAAAAMGAPGVVEGAPIPGIPSPRERMLLSIREGFLGRAEGLREANIRFEQAFSEGRAGLQEAIEQVEPGFGALTQAGVEAIRNRAQASRSDLQSNLARRRILGSSFAEDQLARHDLQASQEEAQFRAAATLEELDTRVRLINQRTELDTQAAQTVLDNTLEALANEIRAEEVGLDELNRHVNIALSLSTGMIGEIGANSRLEAELASRAAQQQAGQQLGFGERIQTLGAGIEQLIGAFRQPSALQIQSPTAPPTTSPLLEPSISFG